MKAMYAIWILYKKGADGMITVEHLRKEFTYYKKMTGIKGSLHNIFHRESLTKEAVRDISFSVGSRAGYAELSLQDPADRL